MLARTVALQKMLQYLFSTGMSYRAVAKATGLNVTTITRLVSNEGRIPRTGTYDRILRACAARRDEMRPLEETLKELDK